MSNNPVMNCVYTTSNSYAEITGISILSLLHNNSDVEQINVFVIDNQISEQNKKNLVTVARMYNRNLYFLDKPRFYEKLDFEMNTGRWHISTFFRLFMSSVLPQDIHKIIYIDSDTIIRKSLYDLYQIDLEDYIVAGVDDFRSNNYKLNIGLEPTSTYINNGFLLIDLDKWKTYDIEHQFLNFINLYKGDITYMDQGVLNGVIGKMNKVKVLPPIYNSQTVFHDFTYKHLVKLRKPEIHATEEEINLAKTDPTVVHFTSCFMSGTRPWMKKNNHPYRNEYIRYKSMSPWKDTPLLKDDRKFGKKLMTFVSNILPKFILIPIISFIHSKVYTRVRNYKQAKNKKG